MSTRILCIFVGLAWNAFALKIQEAPETVDDVVDEIAQEINERSLLQEGSQVNVWQRHFEEQMQRESDTSTSRRRRDDDVIPTTPATITSISLAAWQEGAVMAALANLSPAVVTEVVATVTFDKAVVANSISTCGKTHGDVLACGVPFVVLRNTAVVSSDAQHADYQKTSTGHSTLPYFSGSATTTLTFQREFRGAYFKAGDENSVSGNSVFHNSGAIEDPDGTDATLTHPANLCTTGLTWASGGL